MPYVGSNQGGPRGVVDAKKTRPPGVNKVEVKPKMKSVIPTGGGARPKKMPLPNMRIVPDENMPQLPPGILSPVNPKMGNPGFDLQEMLSGLMKDWPGNQGDMKRIDGGGYQSGPTPPKGWDMTGDTPPWIGGIPSPVGPRPMIPDEGGQMGGVNVPPPGPSFIPSDNPMPTGRMPPGYLERILQMMGGGFGGGMPQGPPPRGGGMRPMIPPGLRGPGMGGGGMRPMIPRGYQSPPQPQNPYQGIPFNPGVR